MARVVPGNRGGGVARHSRTNESTENRAQITSRNASVAVYQQLSMMGRGWRALVGAGRQQDVKD